MREKQWNRGYIKHKYPINGSYVLSLRNRSHLSVFSTIDVKINDSYREFLNWHFYRALRAIKEFKLSKVMKFKKDIVEQSSKIQCRTNSRKLSSHVWWFSVNSKSFENLPNLQRLIIRNLHWSMMKSSNRWLENRANSCETWRSTTKLPASFRRIVLN